MVKLQRARMTVLAGLVACLAGSVSCGDVVRQGRSPGYLIVDLLEASSGAKAQTFSNVLESDVVTNVQATIDGQQVLVPTVFEDFGRVQLRLALKDIGTPGAPTSPTTNNDVTINRYRVSFRRADGRNTPGVDVPYPFDGAVTGTVSSSSFTLTFIIVRAQAKLESPLKNLRNLGGSIVISTIADVTFYGRDQAGNDVSVSGSIGVNFADWGDPASAG
jgi:hypothetical protein